MDIAICKEELLMKSVFKKLLCLTLALLLISALPMNAFAYVWGDEWEDDWPPVEYPHLYPCDYRILVYEIAPTCDKEGTSCYRCTQCTSVTHEKSQPLGHTYPHGICPDCGRKNPADCAHVYKNGLCTLCGFANPETCPHLYTKDTTSPTCTQFGYVKHQCVLCNHLRWEIKFAPGHTERTSTERSATCTVDGIEKIACYQYNSIYGSTYCHYVAYKTIPATGHRFNTSGTCTRCGEHNHVFVDGACQDCGKIDPAVCQHRFGEAINGGTPSCTVDGQNLYVCEDCGYVKKEILPATGHIGENIFCDTCAALIPCNHFFRLDHTCEFCGIFCEHSYQDGTCTLCGYQCRMHEFEQGRCTSCGMDCAHETYKTGTCTLCGLSCVHSFEEGICTTCGVADPDSCEHNFVQSRVLQESNCLQVGQTLEACAHCQLTRVLTSPISDHSYMGGTCTVCGLVCDHNYKNGVCTICNRPCHHNYDNSICLICGELCTHDFARGVWVTQPTCTEDGRKSYTCNDCGYVKYARFPATGHSIENGVCTVCGEACEHSYEDSTCTICGAVCDHSAGFDISAIAGHLCGESGSRRHTCKVCDYSYDQSYATLTHQYEDGICIFCGSEKNDRYEYVVLDDGTCRITRCLRVDDNMTVPDYLDGYLVTEIGMEAFIWASMDVMQLPAGIRSVTASAFSGSTLSELILTGDAPQMNSTALDAGVTVKYPARNETYTQELFDSLSHVIWEPYCADHSFVDGKCEYCGEACVHSLEETVEYAPTCTEEGRKNCTCTVCGYTESQTIPATGHTEQTVPGYISTCTRDGLTDGTICTVCGETLVEQEPIPTQGHKYYMGDCTVCGRDCPHEYGDPVWILDPTCTESGYGYKLCALCQMTLDLYPFPPGHSFTDGTCEDCGEADPNWTGPIGSTLSGEMLLPCENVQVQLYLGDEFIGTATVTGSRYHFDGLDTGEFTLKVSCDGGVPREYAVTVETGDNTLDVALSRPGDVNGDRQTNIIDVAMLYGSIKGTATLDDYATACGDINHDGQVNIIDVAMAYKQVQG